MLLGKMAEVRSVAGRIAWPRSWEGKMAKIESATSRVAWLRSCEGKMAAAHRGGHSPGTLSRASRRGDSARVCGAHQRSSRGADGGFPYAADEAGSYHFSECVILQRVRWSVLASSVD